MTIYTCPPLALPMQLITVTTTTTTTGDTGDGPHLLTIHGLPSGAVREARDRLRAGLTNSGLQLPAEVTVTLDPPVRSTDSSATDLAIAVAALAATGQIRPPAHDVLVIGELGLDGSVRAMGTAPESLAAVIGAAGDVGIRHVLLPAGSLADTTGVSGMWMLPLANLSDPALSAIGPSPAHSRLLSFVKEIAALTAEGDLVDGEPFVMENDDAWATLNAVIEQARELLGITVPQGPM
jgi:hypothetical protein